MKSVVPNSNTIVIKNSRFISLVFPIHAKEEVELHLQEARVLYPDATHYCYAYILDQTRKESDDGEPAGTAGIPILQVLEKQELNHVLCIVIRYFGKIKLGAGGLVRAYAKSASLCLKGHIVTLLEGYVVQITFLYDSLKKIDYILASSHILEKSFREKITYKATVSEKTLEILKGFSGVLITEISPTYLFERDNSI